MTPEGVALLLKNKEYSRALMVGFRLPDPIFQYLSNINSFFFIPPDVTEPQRDEACGGGAGEDAVDGRVARRALGAHRTSTEVWGLWGWGSGGGAC